MAASEFHCGDGREDPVMLPATIVLARPGDGFAKGVGQAAAMAMATASIAGACVVGLAERLAPEPPGARDANADDALAASQAPAAERAAPRLDVAELTALGISARPLTLAEEETLPVDAPGALRVSRTPLADLSDDDIILTACPPDGVGMEPADASAPRCVRVLRGEEIVEVRLRS